MEIRSLILGTTKGAVAPAVPTQLAAAQTSLVPAAMAIVFALARCLDAISASPDLHSAAQLYWRPGRGNLFCQPDHESSRKFLWHYLLWWQCESRCGIQADAQGRRLCF